MLFKIRKKSAIGVSVSVQRGLEIAQIDFLSKKIIKYGSMALNYDSAQYRIEDIDVFKNNLQELLKNMKIPTGSEVVFNIPTVSFQVKNEPGAFGINEVNAVIMEELAEHPTFKEMDMSLSTVILPSVDIQTKKFASIAAQRDMLIEIAMIFKELGYPIITIDSMINSTLNALMYLNLVSIEPNQTWVLLIVEENACHVVSMQDKMYVDYYEEKLTVAEVLGDEENYNSVVSAIAPILANTPSQYLYVLSKTDVISAKKLANMLSYNAPIVYQEANKYLEQPLLDADNFLDESEIKNMSLDVIGAAINREFIQYSVAPFNLFNEELGYVFLDEQPLKIGKYSLTLENSINIVILMVLLLILPIFATTFILSNQTKRYNQDIDDLNKNISVVKKFLKDNEEISTEEFFEGDEIQIGLSNNKRIYSFYTILGTEIPQKLWLTKVKFDNGIMIDGQADNIESIYTFFRNLKDYDTNNNLKLQKLGLASKNISKKLSDNEEFDTNSILTSFNADFYQFRISDIPRANEDDEEKNSEKNDSNKFKGKTSESKKQNPPPLEPLDEDK